VVLQAFQLIAELDRLGLRENTIIVLWGDHGYQLGEHGTWNKRTNWEIATRAPLILAMPGQLEPAARLLGATAAVQEANSTTREPVENPARDHFQARLREQLGDAEFSAAWAAGHQLSVEQAILEAFDG
jgi:membrane-anchored protein YejM (alkaline phosphatase superfamily)